MEPVTKIYRISVEGFQEAKAELGKMSTELENLKKKKQELDKELAKASTPAQISEVNKNIQAQVTLEADLTKRITEKNKQIQLSQSLNESNGADGIGAAIIAYQNLIKQYKEALSNSQLMEAQFGKESAEAIEAARTAAIYEAELIKINKLRGAPIPTTQNIPFTTNLDALEAEKQSLKETGTVVNEFDLAQAEAAITATEFGESQRLAAGEVKATEPAFAAVKGSLDQYTGSLRDNIRAQIENAQAIAANKAAQKEINDAIKASGAATTTQIERLAALKEEAVILDQSNKSLTTTIRNQAREFVSSTGSLEEGRAKVNQLQQAYAQLSEAERASPFGQGIKQEIDIIEPKVKELEATIGLFQRNVGNYPSNFTGAFKVLDTELDTLKGKLVQGNFSGKEFDELTKKTAILNTVTENLNTTFKTTTAEQTAYKEAARVVAAEFGTESQVFQSFSKEVSASNSKLKETDVALNVVSTTGNKATAVFKNIFGALRQAANILPGIGLSGLILLLITPLEALASKVADYVSNIGKASDSTKDFKLHLEEMNNAVHESQKEFVDAFTAVESLRINVDLASKGFLNKDEVLKQYNDTMGKTAGKLKDFNDIEKKLVDSGPAYIQMMLLRAAANVALESAAKKAFEAEEARRKSDLEFSTFFNRFNTQVSSAPGLVPDNGTEERARKAREKAAQEAKAKVIKEAEDAKKLQISIAEDFQKQAAELQKKNNFSLLPQPDAKKTKERADRLNVEEQNELKRIDATYKTELAAENTRFTEIEKVHSASFDEEIFHAKRVEEITVNSLNSKIALLSRQKKLNAEELATLAEFREKRSEIELQTSQQIQEIEKKRFADQDKDLKQNLDRSVKAAKDAQQKILDNPNNSNLDKARASLQFLDEEIGQYEIYYNELLSLNSNFNQEELRKVKSHIKDLQTERSRGLNTDLAAQEKDIQAQGERTITEQNIVFQEQRNSILSNEKLTLDEKNRLVETLTRANNITILSKELETINEQLKVKFQQLLKNDATDSEYEKLHLAALKKAGELEEAQVIENNRKLQAAFDKKPHSTQDLAVQGADNLLGVDKDSPEGKAVGEAIAQSFDLATSAMHGFYDAERSRIQQSLELNLQRLDLEEQQVKARATSQAEIDSIDKQYAQKKKDAQKAAGEEIKKSKRAELKIALVTEIANDAVAAAAYPFPFNLGIFAVMAALAYGRYAVGLSSINSQQFERGGEVPKRGGKFGGRRHAEGGTKFRYQDNDFEAEVDELAIIRTRNVRRDKKYQLTGTHTEIASALNVLGGGIAFQPGAKLKKFESGGSLASTLQAPVFTPSSSSNSFNSQSGLTEAQLNAIIGRIDKMNDETSKRFERIEVVQVTSSVSSAIKKQVQQRQIGTL